MKGYLTCGSGPAWKIKESSERPELVWSYRIATFAAGSSFYFLKMMYLFKRSLENMISESSIRCPSLEFGQNYGSEQFEPIPQESSPESLASHSPRPLPATG
ncbi:unnamed protein product [Withania somnifera]